MENVPYEHTVEEILRIDQELLARIDAKLAELRKLKASHMFTVEATGEPDHFLWTCSCGNFTALQYPPGIASVPVGALLLGHVREAYQ